ncbi:MAG: twin-arginine translocase subunit TatB [Microthrixaceae bacterium]|nr:twin-arginine translocase subunit TatB [Acidimicrobiales bacterium]MCB9404921.1 twin-arginine translocase subunit TatB [Microthrixaceae bacterium]
MFNVGGPEIMVVLLVALVVLGPEQLPKAMRTFGNVMAQVRKLSNGFQAEMRSAMNSIDVTSPGGSATPGGSGSSSTASSPASTPSPVSPPAPATGPNPAPSSASSADRAAG